MQLLILVLVAGLIGFFVARSKFSKPIDNAAGKVAETSKDASEKAKGWWGKRFGKKETEESTSTDAPSTEDEKKSAEKSVSRRKEESTEN